MDPLIRELLDRQAAAASGRPAPGAVPVALMREGYRAQRQGQNRGAPKDVLTRDLQVRGGEGDIPARLYTPAGAPQKTPGLVYFHGGGFVIGDLESHDGHCRRLAAYSGVRVLAVDYRLAPEWPFPAAHDDALAATLWAFDHADALGFDPDRLAVGGCSAGGNLAASVALALRGDASRRLAFQLLLYPVIWPKVETSSRARLDGPVLSKAGLAWFEATLAAKDHPQGARNYLEDQTVAGAPPALVVTAGYDPLKDEGRDYALKLQAAGVPCAHREYAELIHDFYLLGDVTPAVELAARETARELKAALS